MCPDHLRDCPCFNWDYKNFDKKGVESKVRRESKVLWAKVKNKNVNLPDSICDTRPIHKRMFAGLTAKGCDYFAGNYRGSRDCLIDYNLQSPPGTASAADVNCKMAALSQEIAADWKCLEELGNEDGIGDADSLIRWIDVALERMISFLTIHPYANGNGHISRFLVFCYLRAAGIVPESWPIDKRPPGPYAEAIAMYRQGYVDELRAVVVSAIYGDKLL